jgi:hypothetical protein
MLNILYMVVRCLDIDPAKRPCFEWIGASLKLILNSYINISWFFITCVIEYFIHDTVMIIKLNNYMNNTVYYSRIWIDCWIQIRVPTSIQGSRLYIMYYIHKLTVCADSLDCLIMALCHQFSRFLPVSKILLC